jgi:hypothetical protein
MSERMSALTPREERGPAMTMVERLSRKLAVLDGRQSHDWAPYRHWIAALLKEMREPTLAMFYAAKDPTIANGSPMSKGPCDVWQAMVDASLSEGTDA